MAERIQEIRDKLKSFTPENMDQKLPLLKKLLERHHNTRPKVDIERADLMTTYLKKHEKSKIPWTVKRTNAIKHYLAKRQIYFHDHNLLGGASTGKELGAPLYPEYFGLCIWPELDYISNRKMNPQQLSPKEAEKLNSKIFPYWIEKTVSEQVRKEDPLRQGYLEKMVIFTVAKAATLSHATPAYEIVLKKGLLALINEAKEKEKEHGDNEEKKTFYQTLRISMEGLMDYSKAVAIRAAQISALTIDPVQMANLDKIAEICRKVPANPPSTFREAVNSLWLCQVGILAENSNMAINPGRLDQLLYPYFIKDYTEGRLSIDEALTITGCFWLKLADNVNLVPEAAERLFGGAGAAPAITFGGVDKEGRNAVNELTYLLLKTAELLPIRDPNVNARYFPEINPEEYRDEVSRVILSTGAIPAFHNDIENIKILKTQGETEAHARDYAIIGCVELGSAGKDFSASSSIFMMLHTVLYMALHNGRTPVTGDTPIGPSTGEPEEFKTFEQFWEAYKTQYRWVAENAVSLNNLYGKKHQEFLASPLMSAFFQGPMEKGKDLTCGGALYNSSGVTHIGFADTCDSICAIKDVCYNQENNHIRLTLKEMTKAVDDNFIGHENLFHYLKNMAPKYGTDNKTAGKISRQMIKFHHNVFNHMKNYRGGNYRTAYWTMTNHAGYGRVSPALPSGRKAFTVLSSGITPVSQVETQLPEVLKAVAALDSPSIPGSYALNIKLSPVTINRQNISMLSRIIECYMIEGGQQIQFNIHDYKTLQEAQKRPEAYPNLLVRVSGYSAYFKSLNKAMQDELISRSQYNPETGKLIKLSPQGKLKGELYAGTI